jgi:hypothetical protein
MRKKMALDSVVGTADPVLMQPPYISPSFYLIFLKKKKKENYFDDQKGLPLSVGMAKSPTPHM